MNDWFEAEQRIERAQQLCEQQKWKEALAEMDAALRVNPDNGGWWAQRGYVLEQLDRGDEAVTAFARAHQLDPGDHDIAIVLGVGLVGAGRYREAIETLQAVAEAEPTCESAFCFQILARAELGEHEQAEELFYMAQQLEEDCPHCFCHIGISLAARHHYDRAIYCWKRALHLAPDYPQLKRRIAQAYRGKGELLTALDFYRQELREDPGNVDLICEIGHLALDLGDRKLAAEKFRQAVEFDPQHAPAHFALGLISMAQDEVQEALRCFEAVEALDHDLPRVALRMGQCHIRTGNHEKAQAYLRRAVGEAPKSVDALTALGASMLQADNLQGALEIFERAISIDGQSAFAHQSMALCCFRVGRHDLGLSHCEKVVELDPLHFPAMHSAALACIHLGRWKEARRWVRLGIEAAPEQEALRLLDRRLWLYRIRYWFRWITQRVSPRT